MKRRFRRLGRLTVLGVALFAMDAVAQAVVEKKTVEETVEQGVKTTTVTSSGVISDFGPSTFVVKTPTSEDPLCFAYNEATTYVDESGKEVAIANARAGLPVTVYSDKFGDQRVATRVVVTRAVHADPFHD